MGHDFHLSFEFALKKLYNNILKHKQFMLSLIKSTSKNLLDVIYPPICIVCGNSVYEHGSICSKCWECINFISDPQCQICGFPFDFQVIEGAICAGCAYKKPYFSKARSVFLYDENSQKIITNFKYRDKTEYSSFFSRWMVRIGSNMLDECDFIIPIPLHPLKLFLRKYNQASLIANELHKHSKKKVLYNAIIRIKYTTKQASLVRKNRFKNIKGAFRINKKYIKLLEGKNILLVDDVITTGATINECAKSLIKQGKVHKVEALTVAKTLY